MPVNISRVLNRFPSAGRGGKSRLLLPRYALTTDGTVTYSFADTTGWTTTGTGAAVANNDTEYTEGTRSLKCTTGNGVASQFRSPTLSPTWNMSNFTTGSVDLYLHSPLTDVSSFGFYFSNDAALSNLYQCSLVKYARQGEWNRIYFAKSACVVAGGTPSWATAMQKFLMYVTPYSGKVVEISLDNLKLGFVRRPTIMIQFDDGYDEQYASAYPVMQARAIPGTLFVNTSLPGGAGYVTVAQMQEMNAAGWTIANHTNNNTDLSTLTEAEQETALSGGETALTGWGLTKGIKYVAYPSGGYNADTLTAMAATGMVLGRRGALINRPHVIPPAYGLYETDCGTLVHAATNLAAAQTLIDNAIIDGTSYTLVFHQLDIGGEWTTADFTTLMDYIAARRNQITPITIDDYYKLTLGSVLVQ